ncbi:hypothetical protein [Paracoccus aminophilus]|uniref:Uncharacterized protein n=1 Tax=Paracoccus aminophilus JCM 7686 TaxID=1367847 RepID=S5XWN2_PARAH|nr:hypothetical protein [Paracoccus aminophilus]AGT09702.1 hypothetical protein JCM7686_2645 [Paracoccus aminophilus JCM 7686]
MAEPLKLSIADHVLIHALGLLSRPEIIEAHRADLDLQVDILRSVLPMASKGILTLRPLIELGSRFAAATPRRPGFYGPLHEQAGLAMNRWDRQRMADAWDRIQGGGRDA